VVANLQQLFNADRKGKPLKSNQIHPNILVCPINCRHVIQSLISGAQSSIIIQNQYIEDKTLTTLLLAKQKQIPNLKLQIIVADNEFASGTMRRFGTDHARVLTSPYPHAKMMLIDDRYLLVSSINYSSNSMDRNREIGVIITNREAIDYFTTQFTKDRDKSKLISKFKKKYSKSTN
jgi:cardiolipin synthase